MQDSSKMKREIDNGFWLRSTKTDGIPADCRNAYRKIMNSVVTYYKQTIDDMIQHAGGSIKMPMEVSVIEDYLTGFSFEYKPFRNWLEVHSQVEGYWVPDNESADKIIIHYNACAPESRQRFTKVHELFHFSQRLDMQFIAFIDELVLNTTLPHYVIDKILERGTDKATSMYLMPNEYFTKKYCEISEQCETFGEKQLKELAKFFEVSAQSAKYRLNECGIYVPNLA